MVKNMELSLCGGGSRQITHVENVDLKLGYRPPGSAEMIVYFARLKVVVVLNCPFRFARTNNNFGIVDITNISNFVPQLGGVNNWSALRFLADGCGFSVYSLLGRIVLFFDIRRFVESPVEDIVKVMVGEVERAFLLKGFLSPDSGEPEEVGFDEFCNEDTQP